MTEKTFTLFGKPIKATIQPSFVLDSGSEREKRYGVVRVGLSDEEQASAIKDALLRYHPYSFSNVNPNTGEVYSNGFYVLYTAAAEEILDHVSKAVGDVSAARAGAARTDRPR